MLNREPKRVLRFDGTLTLPRIGAIRAALIGAIDGGPAVEIDCAKAAEIDVSFIQLLLAARRAAAMRGKSLTFAAPASGALLQALERGGFLTSADDQSTGDREFWSGETPSA